MQLTTLFVSAALAAVSFATPVEKRMSGTGDLTWYNTGVGSCGKLSHDTDKIVALSHVIMTPKNGANPNTNPLCGKPIKVTYKGKTETATIVDTCGGCAEGDLDASPSLFEEFAPESSGRLHGMTWTF